MFIDPRLLSRKAQLIGVLEHMCRSLELTDTQSEQARKRYQGAGEWLATAPDPILRHLTIFLQGSTALLTTVKPIARNEHDVDLVAHNPHAAPVHPTQMKKAIGDRLRANAHYAPLLVEMARCWRLDYANEFHLDITPSIPNHQCSNGGELVPDKALKLWTPTHPKGYRRLFEQRASLKPRFRNTPLDGGFRSEIEPYPTMHALKGILRRTVQITKRHRDVYFEHRDASLAPISIIITTLASQSYQYCVTGFVYDSEFDLLCDIVRNMPAFIQTAIAGGRLQWFIWNETTQGENFAEKWCADPRRAEAFFTWHTRVLADLEKLLAARGLDHLQKSLADSFGQVPVTKAFDALTTAVSAARNTGRLAVSPTAGLLAASAVATPVRANTFFGAPRPCASASDVRSRSRSSTSTCAATPSVRAPAPCSPPGSSGAIPPHPRPSAGTTTSASISAREQRHRSSSMRRT